MSYACNPRPLTGVLVHFDSDVSRRYVRRVELQMAWVDGLGPDLPSRSYTFTADRGDGILRNFPGSLTVAPDSARGGRVLRMQGTIWIVDLAGSGEEDFVTVRANVPMQQDRLLELTMNFQGLCGTTGISRTCSSAETCVVEGETPRCVPTPSTPLPQYAGSDASVGDASVIRDRLSGVVDLFAGRDFTCAILRDGSQRCWGRGAQGQLLNNSTMDQNLAESALPIARPIGGTAGDCHQCILLANSPGAAWCVGCNGLSQLGVAISALESRPQPHPTRNWRTLSAGSDFTCGITMADELRCWGSGASGQLGNGIQPSSAMAVAVAPAAGIRFTSVGTGAAHACAVAMDQSAWCWGENSSLQTSYGGVMPHQVGAPGAMGPLSQILSIDGGNRHTCALTTQGTVYCWGAERLLGAGVDVGTASPLMVQNLQVPVVELSIGGDTSCARGMDSSVWCWGRNDFGQCGQGVSTLLPVRNALRVSIPGPVRKVASGGTHVCALVDDTVYCWGANNYGQLGQGPTLLQNSSRPLQVFTESNE